MLFRSVLVVSPKSVTDNWRAEAERFVPELRTRVWSSADVGRLPRSLAAADLHIINYAQLRSVGEERRTEALLAVAFPEFAALP